MLNVGGGSFGIIIVTALLDIVLLWAYLNAMQRGESLRVIVYYQLVPILGILAGRAFLREVISHDQLVAMGIVIFGTTIVSLENVKGVSASRAEPWVSCCSPVLAGLIVRFLPKLATERIDRTHVAMKGVAICITGLGTYLLLVAR